MNRIEDELRGWSVDWDGSQMKDGEPPRDGLNVATLRAAAGELARLRAENERLFTENGRLANTLGADNLRLRAALRELHLLMDFDEPVTDDKPIVFGDASEINRAMKQAREAMGYEQSKGDTK